MIFSPRAQNIESVGVPGAKEERTKQDWVKVHITCGVKTNIVTAVEIEGQLANDSKFLPALTATTGLNFTLIEVSADKGYSSKNNAEVISKFGATPFISMKETDKGIGGGKWSEMSPAQQRGIDILYNEAQVWRFAPQQNGRCDGQRIALQNPVS